MESVILVDEEICSEPFSAPEVNAADGAEALVVISISEVKWNALVLESVSKASVDAVEVAWLAKLFVISDKVLTPDEDNVPVVMKSLVIGVRSE